MLKELTTKFQDHNTSSFIKRGFFTSSSGVATPTPTARATYTAAFFTQCPHAESRHDVTRTLVDDGMMDVYDCLICIGLEGHQLMS